ncbi:MAG: hypothetical protein WCD79_08345 [Chthoniobacteraceae bacterium]
MAPLRGNGFKIGFFWDENGFELALNGFVLALFFWAQQSKNWVCSEKMHVLAGSGLHFKGNA